MILHLYFARRFFWMFLGIAMVFVVLLALIDLVDELQDYPDLPFIDVAEVVLLAMPEKNYEIMPLVVILASVGLFLRLSRSSELVVQRAAGRSALIGLLGPAAVAGLIGLLSILIINPLVAASSKRYEALVTRYDGRGENVLAISSEGLWLRQAGPGGHTVIHADRASPDLGDLYDATFLDYTPAGEPLRRILATHARLIEGGWEILNAKIWAIQSGGNAEAGAREIRRIIVPTTLTPDYIADSFGEPHYLPIWELPGFIDTLEEAGFSPHRYDIWFQSELSRPLYLIALVLMAATLTLRPARLSNVGLSALGAVLLGFWVHYIRSFAQILGESGQIPVLLAAWAPPLAALFLALGILLHREDG